MQQLKKSFLSELIKVKNTSVLWLIIVAAAFLPIMQLLSYMHTNGSSIRLDVGENPWDSFARNSFAICSVFIIPMFVVLLVCLLLNIEHKSNTWKHLFVLPVSKKQIFISKYILIVGLLGIFYILFLTLVYLDAWFLTNWIKQANPNHLSLSWPLIAGLTFQSFISTLPILAIHFWLSFRIKNLVNNIGIGFIGIITGLVLASPGTWDKVFYYPYAYPALLAYKLNPEYHYADYPLTIISLIFFLVLSSLSYIDFNKNFRA